MPARGSAQPIVDMLSICARRSAMEARTASGAAGMFRRDLKRYAIRLTSLRRESFDR